MTEPSTAPPPEPEEDPRDAWRFHAKANAVVVGLAVLSAVVLWLNGPMATFGDGTDIREALWILLAVGVVSHAAISTAVLVLLLKAMPPEFAAMMAHAIAFIGAGGVVTFAIVFIG